MDLVAVDLGGTNCRFAIAEVVDGGVVSLGAATTLRTAEHASLASAWAAYARLAGRDLPRAASLAVACPISGDVLQLTNSPWALRPAALKSELDIDRLTLINDFGAVGHAVAQLPEADFRHVTGPDGPLPKLGVVGILGPGTGLGVAHVLRTPGAYHVIESEGGHVDFAPLDSIDDGILARLRARYRRVSAERVVSGPGLANIYEYLATLEGRDIPTLDDKAIWTAALDGSNSLAVTALGRFCLLLGSVAGDLALAQGAHAMVIGGGIGTRIAEILPHSGFASRFTAKGRLEAMLCKMPVKLIAHEQPGLFGAAAAFAMEHTR